MPQKMKKLGKCIECGTNLRVSEKLGIWICENQECPCSEKQISKNWKQAEEKEVK